MKQHMLLPLLGAAFLAVLASCESNSGWGRATVITRSHPAPPPPPATRAVPLPGKKAAPAPVKPAAPIPAPPQQVKQPPVQPKQAQPWPVKRVPEKSYPTMPGQNRGLHTSCYGRNGNSRGGLLIRA